MKKWKIGESDSGRVLSQELTECMHRQLYTLPARDDILTSFYRPLEDGDRIWRILLVSHVSAMEEKAQKLLKNEG